MDAREESLLRERDRESEGGQQKTTENRENSSKNSQYHDNVAWNTSFTQISSTVRCHNKGDFKFFSQSLYIYIFELNIIYHWTEVLTCSSVEPSIQIEHPNTQHSQEMWRKRKETYTQKKKPMKLEFMLILLFHRLKFFEQKCQFIVHSCSPYCCSSKDMLELLFQTTTFFLSLSLSRRVFCFRYCTIRKKNHLA